MFAIGRLHGTTKMTSNPATHPSFNPPVTNYFSVHKKRLPFLPIFLKVFIFRLEILFNLESFVVDSEAVVQRCSVKKVFLKIS